MHTAVHMLLAVLFVQLCMCCGFLDIYMPGLPNRILANVSHGLDRDTDKYGHQCIPDTGQKKTDTADPLQMTYTPNRRVQASTVDDAAAQRLQLAFTVVLGGHRDGSYNYGASGSLNGLAGVWDSWVDHFFTHTSNTTSFIFLLEEKEFLLQNYTTSKERYMDSIFVDNLGMSRVECVRQHGHSIADSDGRSDGGVLFGHHRRRLNPHHHRSQSSHGHGGSHGDGTGTHMKDIRPAPPGCTNELKLDQGYRVYYLDVATETNPHQAPIVVFASIHKFVKPDWAKDEDEEHLEIHWRPFRLPKRFNTNYAYTKLTNWYAYHLLTLNIIDYFDYLGKIDNDVSFLKGFPEPNLPYKMSKGGHMAMGTQKEWYYDDPRVANGVKFCLENFMENETKQCKRDHKIPEKSLHPAGINDPTLWESNLNRTFRSHFMTYWLGLYTSPEVKLLAKHWNDFHPHGMWDYRWGDQQWWPRPIAMFTNTSISITIDQYDMIDTDNDKYVKHKEYPRSATLKDCVYLNISHPITRLQRDECYKKAYTKYIY